MAAAATSTAGPPPSQDQVAPINDLEPQATNGDRPSAPPTPLRTSLSWKSIKSTISLSEKTSSHLGWIVALLSVLLTIVALSPTFKSQSMSEKALKLAEWTALKDYIEECREELAAGIRSNACLRAMNAKLPPPPHVEPGILDTVRRSLLRVHYEEHNGTSRGAHVPHEELHLPKVIQGIAFLSILLTACVFLFLSFENSRSRMRRRSSVQDFPEKIDEKVVSPPPPFPEPEIATTTIRHPPPHEQSALRRRNVRVHPVYRHANLEEALHHEDIAEIRLRLRNNEDVTKHWPYLIYKLAISPRAPEMEKRLEIAQLCLDYGADVNALRGWNGQSALMIAIHFSNVAVAKLLISNGALVWYSPPDSHLTALHRCVRLAVTGSATDALEIMNMLFKYGAGANQEDRLGETPLHKLLIDAWCAREDSETMDKLYPVADCLVTHGAHMPKTLKEKYKDGNPLWDMVDRMIFALKRADEISE